MISIQFIKSSNNDFEYLIILKTLQITLIEILIAYSITIR